MAGVVPHPPVTQPGMEAVDEERVGEVFAPQRAVFDSRFGQRAVQIEHPNQTRPGAAPVGDGQNRPFVGDQAVQNMVAVLPDGLGND